MDDKKQKIAMCPHCQKDIDPLRAQAVSIVKGKITHFCSVSCRESFLKRIPSIPPEFLPVNIDGDEASKDVPKAKLKKENKAKAIAKNIDIENDTSKISQKDDFKKNQSIKNYDSFKFESSHLNLYRIVEISIASFFLLAALLTAFFLEKIYITNLIGLLGFVAAFFVSFYADSKFFVLKWHEPLGLFFSALLFSVAGFFSDNNYHGVMIPFIFIARSLGRLLEYRVRLSSGIMALIQTINRDFHSDFRDNSILASQMNRFSNLLVWFRFVAAFFLGVLLKYFFKADWNSVLLGPAIILLVLDSRLFRMITIDAYFQSAYKAAKEGIKIKDSRTIDKLSKIRVVLFMSREALMEKNSRLVDWQIWNFDDENKVIKALLSAQKGVDNSYSKAVLEAFPHEDKDIVASNFKKINKGIIAKTQFGELLCGSRSLLLDRGISTAMAEKAAFALESTGRRVFFVALDNLLVATFGLEETPLLSAAEVLKNLNKKGYEPCMITQAEAEPGMSMGKRLGIENVRFEKHDEDLKEVLNSFEEAHYSAVLVGHGKAFEENVAHAHVAICNGNSCDKTKAGINAGSADLKAVLNLLMNACYARRSINANMLMAFLISSVGFCLAMGWNTVGMFLFFSILVPLLMLFFTVNGPYMRLQRLIDKVDNTRSAISRWIGITLSKRG